MQFLAAVLCASTPIAAAQDQADPNADPITSPASEPELILDQGSDDLSGILDLSAYHLRDLTLYWDNDGTVPNLIDDTDEFYTNGAKIELSFDPHLAPALRERLAPAGDWVNPRFGVGLGIAQRMYTPRDLQRTPFAREHPYAGYLYLSFAFQRADDRRHDHFGLDVGVIGPSSGAGSIQKWIHNTFPDEIFPLGWETQLDDEPTINFNYTRTWKAPKAKLGDSLEFELLPRAGFDLGTVSVAAKTEMTARIGLNLPKDFGPAALLDFKDHTVSHTDAHDKDWSVYLYGSMGVDLVLHDVFLDGNVFQDSRSAQREALVHEFSFGLVARYKALYLGWSQHFQSERFELQGSTHAYGSIVFGCSFDW